MNKINPNYWLVIFGFVLIGIEIVVGAATGFDLLLVGLIFLASGIVGIFFSSITVSLILAASLAFFYVLVGRRMVRKSLNTETKTTNIDALMGRTAIVAKRIVPHHAGQVKIDGEIWRAASEKELEIGEKVVIKSVSGVTLRVD